MTQWTLTVPEKTDRALRTYLARTGGGAEAMASFVDTAVRQRLVDMAVRNMKDRNADRDQQAILNLIDDEVGAERADRS